jgi:bifunctional enzyme CysN/CysC
LIVDNDKRDLLRFLTAGSVDDGKSTLIGRLLFESDAIYDDQLFSVKAASLSKNIDLDLSLLTDGLRAEREQGITIDVAYRYFSTAKRKFIIADAPGHEQYTRNMATAASTAQLALILLDARKGVLRQTRRHTLIASLLGIRRMIVAVNKMDLVEFDPRVFDSIRDDFNSFAKALHIEFHFVPMSALLGDNVVERSRKMDWYEGESLLHLLEAVPAEPGGKAPLRFPVQSVLRPNQDFRGYAGQLGSGSVSPGQDVVALPSGQRTKIKEVISYTQALEVASAFRSVVLTTIDHIDLGRGDMLVTPDQMPTISTTLTAYLIWVSHISLRRNARYLIKHTTNVVCGKIVQINNKIEIDTFEKLDADCLQLNEIGEVQIALNNPILCDEYEHNRATGSFILIDPCDNDTVAAGIIVEAISAQGDDRLGHSAAGSRIARQQGLTVWFTGLSGSGKTTICNAVATELLARGLRVEVIDGDVIRNYLCKDLGFSKQDRDENIRRIAFVSQVLTRNGTIVLVSAISPYKVGRDDARRKIGDFMEVYVSTPLAVCELRDPKDLYKKARAGQIRGFTGIDDPYEPPVAPELVCNTDRESTRQSSAKVVASVLRYLSQEVF